MFYTWQAGVFILPSITDDGFRFPSFFLVFFFFFFE